MLLLGHIGLTIGITKLCQDLITFRRFEINDSPQDLQPSLNIKRQDSFLKDIQEKMKLIDYRFILLGCLLPDIIDKPLWLFTNNIFFNWDGRGYSHTFLFSLVLLVFGLILAARWKKVQLLTVSAASFLHLVFDMMWLNPTALWWPLLGPIPREQIEGYLLFLWNGLLSDPYTYISECLGLIIILFIGIRVIWKNKVTDFIKTGGLNLGFR